MLEQPPAPVRHMPRPECMAKSGPLIDLSGNEIAIGMGGESGGGQFAAADLVGMGSSTNAPVGGVQSSEPHESISAIVKAPVIKSGLYLKTV